MRLIRSAIMWYHGTSTSSRDAQTDRGSRRCRTQAQYRTILHDRTADHPHEFLGSHNVFGQVSRTFEADLSMATPPRPCMCFSDLHRKWSPMGMSSFAIKTQSTRQAAWVPLMLSPWREVFGCITDVREPISLHQAVLFTIDPSLFW